MQQYESMRPLRLVPEPGAQPQAQQGRRARGPEASREPAQVPESPRRVVWGARAGVG